MPNTLESSIAIAEFYLFMTQAEYCHTYHRGLKDHERMFRLEAIPEQGGNEWIPYVMRPWETILAVLPHVEAVQGIGMQVQKALSVSGRKDLRPPACSWIVRKQVFLAARCSMAAPRSGRINT